MVFNFVMHIFFRNFVSTFLFLIVYFLSTELMAAPKYASFSLDAATGEILHNNQGFQSRYPASLTKVMTLYLIFEDISDGKIQKSDLVTFSRNASSKPASKLGLAPGEKITFSNAIKALAIKSANDVATAVAEHISGSEESFALRMTDKARELGMYQTSFKNASGLHNNYQKTTAFDMAILGLRMLKDFPAEASVFSQKDFIYEGKTYRSHNKLLFSYQGTKGMKTGFTNMSGFNLLSYVTRDNKKIISVVMGGSSSNSRNSNMVKVLNKSIKLAKYEIPFPRLNPFLEGEAVYEEHHLSMPKDRKQSRFETLSNRVDKILAIFP
ncbi:MAG: hypothetical protein CML86_03305 [Rhodobiaceae bacterium]|nr:hypothetical protein [Rhodobiaceae bacterium]